MFKIETLTPANFSPVSLADFKLWARTNDTADDTLIPALVTAASDKWTADTSGHVLCSATYRLRLDGWPSRYLDQYGDPAPFPYPVYQYNPDTQLPSLTINIPRAPVTAISLVEYLDTSGSWQTLDGYSTDLVSVPARVVLPSNLPTLHPTQRPSVRVTFTAGYADANSIPAGAVVGVKLLANHWYNSGTGFGGAYTADEVKELPQGWFALTKQYDTGISGNWNR
jgi:hypothetical protein